MARRKNGNPLQQSQDALLDQADFLREIVREVLQEVLEQEFLVFMGAQPYERCQTRTGQRNGSYERMLTTRVGKFTLRVPRDRAGRFSTALFQSFQRSEKALLLSLLEMYVQGVSTRKVARITEILCGTPFSKDQVSDLSRSLDGSLALWRGRSLQAYYPYLFVDATYYRVHEEGRVLSLAALLVMGVDPDGRRELLATGVVNGETESDYLELFRDLKERGVLRVDLVVSDDHLGLKAAIARGFPRAAWQRCWVHVLRNLDHKVPARHRAETRARLKEVVEAPNREEGRLRLKALVEHTARRDPNLADWLDRLGPDLLAHMEFPVTHWKKIRSNNMLERVNEELRRRIQVLRIFPNRASCLRMVTALAVEFSEDWQTDWRYVDMAVTPQGIPVDRKMVS